ncbi:hypothetical protein MTR_2g099060 [Medicago truncatula]|uniref:Uncharacterized protein n=1 Tax=Medicago truncatula TaxID=3880 RepID=G7IHV9_MEDTR|nr:hypothetical protein MTR_2g099060 [Medicago truncatula]
MEVICEMHICIANLNLRDSVSTFNKEKLINLARFFRHNFLLWSLWTRQSIKNYIMDKLLKKRIVYPTMYLLLKLSSQLHVTTATVERSFSTNFVKNELRVCKGDHFFFNDCRVIYMESNIFDSGKNEKYLATHSKYEVTHKEAISSLNHMHGKKDFVISKIDLKKAYRETLTFLNLLIQIDNQENVVVGRCKVGKEVGVASLKDFQYASYTSTNLGPSLAKLDDLPPMIEKGSASPQEEILRPGLKMFMVNRKRRILKSEVGVKVGSIIPTQQLKHNTSFG